jgi:hypothetical protein
LKRVGIIEHQQTSAVFDADNSENSGWATLVAFTKPGRGISEKLE